MKSEKLLVSEDKQGAEREIITLKQYAKILNGLKKVYTRLDLGQLDNEEIALGLLTNKGLSACESFKNAIIADCISTGNRNKNFIQSMLDMQEDFLLNFQREVREILDSLPSDLQLRHYSFNGEYHISQITENTIKEKYKVYLSDPRQIEIYTAFQTAQENIKTLRTAFKNFAGHDHNGTLSSMIERRRLNEIVVEPDLNQLLYFIKDHTPKN